MAKDKKASTLADLQHAGKPRTETVELEDGEFIVTVRELSGAERFEFAKLAEVGTWETYRWLAHRGLVDPELESEDDLDTIRPEWVMAIAGAVMKLSGIAEESEEDAEKKSEESTATGSG